MFHRFVQIFDPLQFRFQSRNYYLENVEEILFSENSILSETVVKKSQVPQRTVAGKENQKKKRKKIITGFKGSPLLIFMALKIVFDL